MDDASIRPVGDSLSRHPPALDAWRLALSLCGLDRQPSRCEPLTLDDWLAAQPRVPKRPGADAADGAGEHSSSGRDGLASANGNGTSARQAGAAAGTGRRADGGYQAQQPGGTGYDRSLHAPPGFPPPPSPPPLPQGFLATPPGFAATADAAAPGFGPALGASEQPWPGPPPPSPPPPRPPFPQRRPQAAPQPAPPPPQPRPQPPLQSLEDWTREQAQARAAGASRRSGRADVAPQPPSTETAGSSGSWPPLAPPLPPPLPAAAARHNAGGSGGRGFAGVYRPPAMRRPEGSAGAVAAQLTGFVPPPPPPNGASGR